MTTPKLRFKEFDADWNSVSLLDISALVTKGTTPKQFINGDINFLKIEAITQSGFDLSKCQTINSEIHNKELKRSILKEGDILFAIAGATIGKNAIVQKELLPANTNQALAIIRLKENYSKVFISKVLNSPLMEKYIDINISTGAQPNLNLQQIGSFSFALPKLNEQIKIASFLSAVDEKITQLTQKHQLLSQYKQGMMQKLFNQQIRFKADDGSEFGEWKSVFLGDISKPQQWKTISSSELTEIGYPVFGANGYIGFYPKYNHINETIAVTCRGATCGEVTLVKAKSYITGNAMSIDEINENEHLTLYIYYALCFRGFKDVISGSAQPQIVGNAIRKVTFQIPCLEEQTKIANFLSAIDQKIDVASEQLEQAKLWKKGLLQQMFV